MIGRAAQISWSRNEAPRPASAEPPDHRLARLFREARDRTTKLCEPLLAEDFCVQSMPDASPPKWHLAHTSWFFEQFILIPYSHGYQPYHRLYGHLFNSYYKNVGPHLERSRRGLLSRPTIEEIYRYRSHVEENLMDLLSRLPASAAPEVLRRLELGIHHEQQHQELLLTDILHLFWSNPLRPAYRGPEEVPLRPSRSASHDLRWVAFEGGMTRIGAEGGFAFDNELPRHSVYLDPFELASRAVTCGEFLEFIGSEGYAQPGLWLSDGWDAVQRGSWTAPLYWEKQGRSWWRMSLHGMRPVAEDEPVCHVSFYEADAFARWKQARLPAEAEWEAAAAAHPAEGTLAESGALSPRPAPPSHSERPIQQLYGDVWEWTASPYRPYPGYRASPGALGEYNGKFMCNQLVLRGGSFATPAAHIRSSYRNFFPPEARWQFTGFRLAR